MSKPWRIDNPGKLQVLHHGVSPRSHFETRKTAALLAYLALTLPKATSREQLAEMLWPDEDSEVTRTRLRQALAALRRMMEPPETDGAQSVVLIADRTSIRLNPDAVTTDATEFEACLRAAAKTEVLSAKREALQFAVDLYQGETLPGFYEDFALDARRRLSEAHRGALVDLALVFLKSGDPPGAVAAAKQAVEADACDEAAHLCLMRAYAAAGRASDALKQARDLERILRREWDTAPSEEARAFAASLRGAPALSGVAGSAPALAGAGGSHAFSPLADAPPSAPEILTPSPRLTLSPTSSPPAPPRGPRRIAFAAVLACSALIVGGLAIRSRAPRPQMAAPDRRVVAVLPFDISSSDGAANAYFADGLAEEMTNTLGKIGALTVIGRTSSARIKESLASGGALARDLNVGTLITGHISKEPARLRVTVEAVDARSQRVIWSEEYDKAYQASQVLEIEQDVARRVAASLRVRLSAGEQSKIVHAFTDNFSAYDCYLRGRYLWSRRTEDSLKRAIVFYDRAIELDPRCAPAYAGEADAYDVLGYYGYIDSETASSKARFAAGKALDAADGDDAVTAAAETSLAWEQMVYQRNWSGAESHFQSAIQRAPDYATARQWRSLSLMLQGRDADSISEIDIALKKDPLSFIIETSAGGRCYHARHYNQAIRRYDEVLSLNPEYTIAYFWRALAREKADMRPEARNDLQKAVGGSRRASLFLAFLAKNDAENGRRAEALQIRAELRRRAATEYVSPFCMAAIEAGLGNNDRAFLLLQTACDTHDGALTFFAEAAPAFDSLRADPRYAALRRRMGLPQH